MVIGMLEKGISEALEGETKFEMEDAHAWYFLISNGEIEMEVKIVREDGVLWKRESGAEDWDFTFLTKEDLMPVEHSVVN